MSLQFQYNPSLILRYTLDLIVILLSITLIMFGGFAAPWIVFHAMNLTNTAIAMTGYTLFGSLLGYLHIKLLHRLANRQIQDQPTSIFEQTGDRIVSALSLSLFVGLVVFTCLSCVYFLSTPVMASFLNLMGFLATHAMIPYLMHAINLLPVLISTPLSQVLLACYFTLPLNWNTIHLTVSGELHEGMPNKALSRTPAVSQLRAILYPSETVEVLKTKPSDSEYTSVTLVK